MLLIEFFTDIAIAFLLTTMTLATKGKFYVVLSIVMQISFIGLLLNDGFIVQSSVFNIATQTFIQQTMSTTFLGTVLAVFMAFSVGVLIKHEGEEQEA